MARRQGTLSRGSNRIQDVVEPREATGMYVLILVRVLIRIGMLDHSGANGVIVILLLLASAGGQKRGKEPQCQSNTFHAKFLSRYIEAGLPAISVSVSLGDSPNIIQR